MWLQAKHEHDKIFLNKSFRLFSLLAWATEKQKTATYFYVAALSENSLSGLPIQSIVANNQIRHLVCG